MIRRCRLACLLVLALTGCASPTTFASYTANTATVASTGAVGKVGGATGVNQGAPSGMLAGGVGVTPGGAQDFAQARALIQQGVVPPSQLYAVEGLYAEHDLPVGEAPAGKTLHVSWGVGVAAAVPQTRSSYWVQVGLGSGLGAAALQRPRLDLALVIDRSGSMSQAGKMEALHQALNRLVDRLDEGDRVSLVAFDHEADVLVPLTRVTDRAALHRVIDGIAPQGSTDMELGMRRGYQQLAGLMPEAGRERRLMLFTDAQPNTGRTDEESFSGLVSWHASRGIGLTAFGIGLDFGAALAEVIGNQRGGNYVFLANPARVRTVFDEEFDQLVTPAAYDLELRLAPGAGLKLADVYGAGTVSERISDYQLKVKTLFFSRNRGALVLRLEPEGELPATGSVLVAGSMRYLERDGATLRTEALACTLPPELADGFAPPMMRKTVALTNTYLALREASQLRLERREGALGALATARQGLERAAEVLGGDDLADDIALVDRLTNLCR